MAVLLEDIYSEMKMAMVDHLKTKCSSDDSLVELYNQFRGQNEQPILDLNNQTNLAELISQGMTAKDIANFYSTGNTFLFKNIMGNIEAVSIDGLKSKVMMKAGLCLSDLINDPTKDPILYKKIVTDILGPYVQSLASQGK